MKIVFLAACCLAALGTLSVLAGCGGGSGGPGGSGTGRVISETGTVQYVNLEGGFYGIMGASGQKYLPLNLGTEFRQDGLRVRFEARERTGVITYQQWGTPIEVTSMQQETGTQ